MKRRWIIRSLSLLPLVYVLAVWVVNCFGSLGEHMTVRGHIWTFGAVSGMAVVVKFDLGPNESMRWKPAYGPHETADDWGVPRTTFGFYAGRWPGIPTSIAVVFPLWLATLLLLLVNWFVWRRTRARPIGQAFPVEPAKVGEAKS